MENLKLFFNTFLDAIEYDGNNDDFVKKFTSVVYAQATSSLISRLPEEKRKDVMENLSSITDGTILHTALNEFFSEEILSETLNKSAEVVLREYLSAIYDSLTSEQRSRVETIFITTE
ncbi:MAG: hypothetical protein A3A97_03550 [Candidatus Terrybacteria bacterium RIFCSPLOWO2_01_FULL_40_23]|uniref:Uncharacterized protein n=1 Tax=Candidatus Terrybacteria bacterium RIFCSPLOWO2_01_FULL_40_23 TaxID=1802366 RepID=A0A1G2PPZ5_9BACT|nr:MAG: hypothetical protein A3A97_03550 [Candidatus Terrybacteria bacterium RIFCSPLOWO2_01_FULL_40_23]